MPNTKFINRTRPSAPAPTFAHPSASAHQSMRPSAVAYNEKLDDEKLYALCKKYGAQARLWRQKFIGLLPEVNRRRLYEEKGFSSIFEFAAKLCGLSAEQVRLALNLEKRFEDKPILQALLVNGEVSMNKLARVASIATAENQEALAQQVKLLPQKALETLVRDEKYVRQSEEGMRAQTNLQQSEKSANDCVTAYLQLSPEVEAKLLELQNKGIDVNELLLEFIRDRERKIALHKEWLAINEIEARPEVRPYINVATERLLKEEYGTKCSIENCTKPSKQIHHTQRFGLSKNNDPHFLAPLCSDHHIIAHSIDTKFHRVRERALR